VRLNYNLLLVDTVFTSPGGHAGGVTPVPISNTEVKPSRADDTAAVRLWESRTLPGLNKRSAGFGQQAVFIFPGSATYFQKITGGIGYPPRFDRTRRLEQAWFGPLPGLKQRPAGLRISGRFCFLVGA